MRFKPLLLGFLCTLGTIRAFANEKPAEGEKEKINWMTFPQVDSAMQVNPKKVFVDVYTHWCGPCKMMSKNTLEHPAIVSYVNEHYYAIKWNAESGDSLYIGGKSFTNPQYQPNKAGRNGTHQLTYAIALLDDGKILYPTTVYFDEGFNLLSKVPGYQGPKELDEILHFFGEGAYLSTDWETYKTQYDSDF